MLPGKRSTGRYLILAFTHGHRSATVPRVTVLLGALLLAIPAGVVATANPSLGLLLLALPSAVALVEFARRWPVAPVALVMAASAVAVTIFLPASAGDEGQRSGLERYGLVLAGATAVAFVLALANNREADWFSRRGAPALDGIMLVFVFVAAMAAAIGLASGNSTTYLLGDVYRIAILPAGYFLTVFGVRNEFHARQVVVILGLCLLAQHVRDALYSLDVLAAGGQGRVKSVFWIQNLAGVIALALLAFSAVTPAKRITLVYGALFMLVVGLSRGFRTYLLALACVVLAPLFVRPSNLPAFARGTASALLICAPALLAALMFVPAAATLVDDISTSFEARLSAAGSAQDTSASQRSLELDLVVDRLTSDPVALFAGTGAGAVYQLPYWASTYALQVYADDDGRIHNVHNSYGSMALRAGLSGLAAIIALFAIGLWQGLRLTRIDNSALGWLPFLIVLAYTLASPFFFFVPGDIVFAIVLGLLSTRLRIAADERATATLAVAAR